MGGAAPEAQSISQPELEEFAFDNLGEESADFGAQGAEPSPPPPPAASVPPPASVAPGETGTPTGTGMDELEEFLAEADFYFQQGLVDEAEFIYTKLLKLAPGHPVVTRQLRKLEEKRALSPVVPEATADVELDEDYDREALRPRLLPILPPRFPAFPISSRGWVRRWEPRPFRSRSHLPRRWGRRVSRRFSRNSSAR